jgi:hypothetical protein
VRVLIQPQDTGINPDTVAFRPLDPTIDQNMADMLLGANAQILAESRIPVKRNCDWLGSTFIFAIL